MTTKRLFDEEGMVTKHSQDKAIGDAGTVIRELVQDLLKEGYHPRDLQNWLHSEVDIYILSNVTRKRRRPETIG